MKILIPPGACPTATGTIATTSSNPLYGSYGWTRTFTNGDPKPHFGVDYAGEVGDDVYAMYDGIVGSVGPISGLGKNNVRVLSTINGIRYNVDYGHLSKALVTKDDPVFAGKTIIGLMGRDEIKSGFPTHVHIAVWRDVNGKYGYVRPNSHSPYRYFDNFGNWSHRIW